MSINKSVQKQMGNMMIVTRNMMINKQHSRLRLISYRTYKTGNLCFLPSTTSSDQHGYLLTNVLHCSCAMTINKEFCKDRNIQTYLHMLKLYISLSVCLLVGAFSNWKITKSRIYSLRMNRIQYIQILIYLYRSSLM